MATGKVINQTTVYYGPSTSYPSESSYAGPNETVTVLWKEGTFYYIEYATSTKRKRMYITTSAVSSISGSVPTVSTSLAVRYVITSAYAYTGPSASNFTQGNYLAAGTQVSYVSPQKEGDFALVEVTISGVKKRLWFEHMKLGPSKPVITTRFYDFRANGFNITNDFGGNNGHLGIDATKPSDPYVKAIADGVVHSKSTRNLTNNGWTITLKHQLGAKTFYSFYAHMDSQPPIAVGANVSAGQSLHPYGNSGNSRGAHIHCGVYTGVPADDMYGYFRDTAGKEVPFEASSMSYKSRVFYDPEIVCSTNGGLIV